MWNRRKLASKKEKMRSIWKPKVIQLFSGIVGEHDHIASDLFNIHVVTEFSRDVIILTYNGCVLKLNR